jgi:hypothetical protein
MDTLADYEAWKAKKQQNTANAANVVLSATNVKPDEVATDLKTADEFAKITGSPKPPLPLVTENRSVFQAEIERKKNETILSGSPRLSEWLRDPENAAVAKDDLSSLSWFEGFARGTVNTLARAGEQSKQMFNQYMLEQTGGRYKDRQRTFGQILEDERTVVKTASGDIRMWPTLGDFISATGRYIDAKYADLIGTDDAEAARQYAAALNENIERLKAIPKSSIATEAEKTMLVKGATLGQTLQNIGATLVSNPVGVLSWALETAGQSAPQLAAGLATTLATRNPAAGLGVMAGGSYLTERFVSPADFLAEKGIDLSKAEDVGRILADPELLKEASERGVIRGMVIGAFDLASGGLAGRTLAGNPFVEAAAQGVQQALSGSLGEYSARLAAGQEIDWNEIVAEGLAELATTPVDLGIAGRQFAKDRERSKKTDGMAKQVGDVSAQARASALRARSPEKFREFVAQATAGSGGENVFIPAREFVEYFQSAGLDPRAVVDELEGVTQDDLDTALAGGGDLAIPTATYAAKLAGSEHDAFLMENMRFDPDEFTTREAAEFNARSEDALQEAWDLAEQLRQQDEELRSFEQEIYDTMVSRLREAGRSTDVATTEAMLYPAFYRVMAERSGMTTEEFLQAYPLPGVRGSLPEGIQSKDVDQLTRTLAEARSSKTVRDKRRTLLEFIAERGGINDVGGELAARNATLVRREGKKSLRLARKGFVPGQKSMLGGGESAAHGAAVGGQEQFARGFEAYLMEGRAPNAELRSVFEKFRAWLVSVYKRLAGLDVSLSDDIRRVFDRMLATDEEIAKAQSDVGGSSPVFATAEQLGLTADEYASLMKLRQQGEDAAKARLLRETMQPIKRDAEKWFKDERAKVKEQIATQVNAYPHFRAIEWMGNKRWLGEGQPEEMPDMRLSKDILVERYGEGILKTLPRGKQTVYTVDGGVDPDVAAGWFGFDSGDQMLKAMERAPKRTDAIEAETDRVMRELHGDVLHDGTIEAEALAAVHTDKRAQWIAAELKAVAEVAGVEIGLTAKEARATARLTIARMRVRDAMAARRFLTAERKAAQEAERTAAQLARNGVWLNAANRRLEAKARAAAKGDVSPDTLAAAIERRNAMLESSDATFTVPDRTITRKDGTTQTIAGGERTAHTAGYNELVSNLIDAKRRQLLNHALYTEALKVVDEVEKAENYVRRLSKKTTREQIAGAGRRENANIDYLGAIDELLERYDFRKMSGAAEQRRGSLNAFVQAMIAAGRENELAIPEAVLADAARKPYKTLSVEHLRGVIDSMKNLEHVAKRWNKLIDDQKQRDLDEVVTEIVSAFDANLPKRPPGRVRTKAEAARNAGRQFLDLVLNATTILREIDGFKDAGAAIRNLKAPIDAAMNRLTVRKQDAARALEKLYSVYSKKERRAMAVRRHMPELGFALSKWERIAVALNTGNEGNYQRLTDPKVRGSFTEAQVTAILASLDERDASFVQSVWDYLETFRSDIAAREKRTTGVEPQWVEARPVVIAGKTMRGGYYPIKYDPRLSSLARDDETQEIAQSLQAGRFGKAQTRNGHLKNRSQSSGRDVDLDMSVLHRHVNQVIYDLELSEPVANSWRILQNSRVRSAFTDAGRQADFDALETWLKDVAEGELRSSDFVGRSARMLKSNFTAAKLAFNLVTVASQITGLAQTMVVVGKRDFVRGLQASFRPGVAAEIAAKSPFMAARSTTFNKDIYDFYNDPKTGPVASRWGEVKSEWVGPAAFWLMTKVQWLLVDIPTWLAGYHQGLRRSGGDEAAAIAHADDIVKRAQASGLFSDRSAIERGSVSRTARQNDVVRLFTALSSYMFAKFNVAYERTGKASRAIRQEGVSTKSASEVLSWTLDMAFLFSLEAVLMAAIRGRLPDDDDGEDDDGWTTFLAKETGLAVMGTIPFVRDAASVYQGFDGGGAYGGIVGDAAKGGRGLFNIAKAPFSDDDVKASDIKGIINATGLATGLPAAQINRAVDAAWRDAEGKDVSPLEYLLGRRGR